MVVGNVKRMSVVISDEAFQVLKQFQEKRGITTRDEAVDTFFIEHSWKVTEKDKKESE